MTDHVPAIESGDRPPLGSPGVVSFGSVKIALPAWPVAAITVVTSAAPRVPSQFKSRYITSPQPCQGGADTLAMVKVTDPALPGVKTCG